MNKEEKEEKKTQTRKAYGKERSQKMMSFRVDNDLQDWLEKQANKGRYINNLIRTHWKEMLHRRGEDKEYWPDERKSERDDYQP